MQPLRVYSLAALLVLAMAFPIFGQRLVPPPPLNNELTGQQIGEGTRNLVICIHGWNNPKQNNRYAESSEWIAAASQLKSALPLTGSDPWALLLYDWSEDAATGFIDFSVFNIDGPIANATQASRNAAPHGQSLGPRLPLSLRRVHIVAHSAGAWAARETAISILQNNSFVVVQVTLLDPFVPAVVKLGDPYSDARLEDLATSLHNNRISLLENYFADDFPPGVWEAPTLGTQETFAWRMQDVNRQVDWDPNFVHPLGENMFYDWHSGPILFYADTIQATLGTASIRLPPEWSPYDYRTNGWYRSLYYRTQQGQLPKITIQPAGQSSTGSSATLSVTASGPGTLSYQWYKNNSLIIGANNSTHTVNSSTDPPTPYVVRVTDANGNHFFSDRAIVTFYSAPPPPPTAPSIASVLPSQLTGLPLPQTQLLRIIGSGFTVNSTLVFNGSIPSDAARLHFISANEIDYDIRTDTIAADWTVKVINGAQQSNLGYFSVVNPPPNTGSLTVNLSPTGAVSAGAQWRVDGGSYRNTGDTATGLTPGSHPVSFKSVSGYTTPAGITVTVTSGTTTTDTGAYTASILTIALPSISPNGGNFTSSQQVALSCATSGATIRYSLNGLDPTASSTAYSSPLTVNSATTVKARAFKSGYTDSDVATATFTFNFGNTVEAPVFSPNGGSFSQPVSVFIGDATLGATIYYTLNGNDPVNDISQQFNGDFTLNQSATIKARAYKSGYNPSAVVSANFTVSSSQNNDAFANRISTTGSSGQIAGSNLQASKEPGETNIFRSDIGDAANPGGKSVWWTWRAPYSGVVVFDTIGTHFDTFLGIYKGTNVANLTFVAGDDDTALTSGADLAGYATSKVTFQAVQGQDYAVVVDGWHGTYNSTPNYTMAGNIVLNWQMLTPAPTPDTSTDFRWARRAGGEGGIASGDNRGYGVAQDSLGNVYVTGYYLSNAAFSIVTLTNAGLEDAFLAKYDGSGSLQWARRIGGFGSDIGNAVSVDSAGNCYVAGVFGGTANFGNTNLTAIGSNDAFIAKYDPSGNCVWANQAGGSQVTPYRIVAKGQEVHVAGEFLGSCSFGAVTLTNAGQEDLFLAKYNTNGALIWARSAGGTSREQLGGLAVNESGEAVVTGWFKTYTWVFGGFTLQRTFSGNFDFFLAKFDAAGNVLWAKREGGDGVDKGKAVAFDTAGNIYVAGAFQDTTSYGGQTITSAGYYDLFVAKFTGSGSFLWIRQSGGTGWDEPFDIGLDETNNIFVSGVFEGTANFQGTIVNSAGTADVFLSKLSSSGDLIVLKKGGGTGYDVAYAMNVNGAGDCVVTGQFESSAIFGSTVLTVGTNARADVFVTRIGPPFFFAPASPTNNAPVNASIGLIMPVALLSSAFSDVNIGDTHAGSQWVVRRANDSFVVFDSGTDTNNKTSLLVESNLVSGTTYSWWVRYQDGTGLWSEFSQPTTFTVGKLQQTITFDSLSRQTFGDSPFSLNAFASSGLPVSFAVLSGPAIVSGTILTMTGAGLVVLRASQSGDATNAPAPNADQVLIVTPGNNVITDFQRLANGMFTFRFYGEPGTNYVVQASTNLVNWLTLSTNQVSGLGYLEFTDTSATNYSKRFYRIAPLSALIPSGPVLTLMLVGNNVVVSWSTNEIGFMLESATNLPPTSWTTNSFSPAVVGGRYTITNSMTNNLRLYRLKK